MGLCVQYVFPASMECMLVITAAATRCPSKSVYVLYMIYMGLLAGEDRMDHLVSLLHR